MWVFELAFLLFIFGFYAMVYFIFKDDFYGKIQDCLRELEIIKEHDRAIKAQELELALLAEKNNSK